MWWVMNLKSSFPIYEVQMPHFAKLINPWQGSCGPGLRLHVHKACRNKCSASECSLITLRAAPRNSRCWFTWCGTHYNAEVTAAAAAQRMVMSTRKWTATGSRVGWAAWEARVPRLLPLSDSQGTPWSIHHPDTCKTGCNMCVEGNETCTPEHCGSNDYLLRIVCW